MFIDDEEDEIDSVLGDGLGIVTISTIICGFILIVILPIIYLYIR